MAYRMLHNCIKVRDLQRSLEFYAKALHLHEKRRVQCGQVTLVYLGDEAGSAHELELNYRPEHRDTAYDLGENPVHFAFVADDYEASLAEHRRLGCIAMESAANHIYFVQDPDGYMIEIIPGGHFSITERGKSDED
ncbi:VOC family protein [Anaerovibrio sp.]|uniref:VOC family protein n=1 Tax=Anaerovibrio sp. TaxID=1872532 RepID=UPI003F18C80A